MVFSHALETVHQLIPDLDERVSRFETEPFKADDELIAAFCEELSRLCADLQTGVNTRDGEMIRVAAHSIKGMSGTMGFPEISVLAQEIEWSLGGDETGRCTRLCNALIDWSLGFIAENQRSL